MFLPLQDDNPLKSIPFQYVTIGLIVLNVVVFLLEWQGLDDRVIASFAIIPIELHKHGLTGGAARGPFDALPVPESTTLITYMFFHGDIFHLAGNMVFLWVFGDNVEDALGHLKFLAFYLLCGALAGLAHATMLPGSAIPLIGASGGVAGVIGAYLVLHPKVRVWVLAFRFIPLRITAALALGAWIATQILMLLVPGAPQQVAWWAHLGGVVAGALLVIVMRRPGVALFDRGLGSG